MRLSFLAAGLLILAPTCFAENFNIFTSDTKPWQINLAIDSDSIIHRGELITYRMRWYDPYTNSNKYANMVVNCHTRQHGPLAPNKPIETSALYDVLPNTTVAQEVDVACGVVPVPVLSPAPEVARGPQVQPAISIATPQVSTPVKPVPSDSHVIYAVTNKPPQTSTFPPSAYVAAPVAGFVNLNNCLPQYPRASILAEEAGTVRLRFAIGTDGKLLSVEVLISSGHPLLDQAAVDGLSTCKFKPAMRNGSPVESTFTADYRWKLDS